MSRDRSGPPPVLRGNERVTILLADAFGMGGTIRTAFNTAGWLAGHHRVEIVSATRARDSTFFPLPDGVHLRTLDDRRTGCGPPGPRGRLRTWLSALPSPFTERNGERYPAWNLWTDLLLLVWLRSLRDGVLVTTRPRFNVLAGRVVRRSVFLIGQEHLHAAAYEPAIQWLIAREYRHLDALTVLTEHDQDDYGRLLSGQRVRIVHIPNAARQSERAHPIEERGTTIVAAGRLVAAKGFDLLIEAWSRIEPSWPDWTLDVYGRGPERASLERLIEERHLDGRVRLAGTDPDLQPRLERAGIFVLSSRLEGFPLVLIEAMAAGCPVVSFDCPTGPGEIVRDHVNGTLVSPEDVDALAAAIEELMRTPELRARYSLSATETARSFGIDAVGARWEALLGASGDGAVVMTPPSRDLVSRSRPERGTVRTPPSR